MALEKTFSQEYPALDVIKDALKSPNDWEARHTDIGNGGWFAFIDWRFWRCDRLIGAKLRRVYTEPKPTEVETLRGEIKALTAALEQEREKRKGLEARVGRITSTAVNFVSRGGAIVHVFETNQWSICSDATPRGTYCVLLEKVGD